MARAGFASAVVLLSGWRMVHLGKAFGSFAGYGTAIGLGLGLNAARQAGVGIARR